MEPVSSAAVSQLHFDPATYLDLIRADVPAYDDLQDRVAVATAELDARRILDLGAGTGETARRVLALHPKAGLVAVDESSRMLERIDDARVEQKVARLQDTSSGSETSLCSSPTVRRVTP